MSRSTPRSAAPIGPRYPSVTLGNISTLSCDQIVKTVPTVTQNPQRPLAPRPERGPCPGLTATMEHRCRWDSHDVPSLSLLPRLWRDPGPWRRSPAAQRGTGGIGREYDEPWWFRPPLGPRAELQAHRLRHGKTRRVFPARSKRTPGAREGLPCPVGRVRCLSGPACGS